MGWSNPGILRAPIAPFSFPGDQVLGKCSHRFSDIGIFNLIFTIGGKIVEIQQPGMGKLGKRKSM